MSAARGGSEIRVPEILGAAIEGMLIEGYASLFGRVDLGRDRMMPGAFRTSLARRGASGVRLLWQHDPGEPIGRWLEIAEDDRGLKVRGELFGAVARGREAMALVAGGALDGLSIGFRTVRARKAAGGAAAGQAVRDVLEVDLWEISLVTFPLLAGARVSPARRPMPPEPLAASFRRAAEAMARP